MENINNSQKINILDIIQIFLKYWLLFVISGIIFMSAAIFYIKYASKTYSVSMKIAFRSERNRSNSGSTEYVDVNDMMNQQKSFTNEMSFLRSTPQIKAVIKDMNLFTSYYIKEDKIPKEFKFSLINIYKNTPFLVVVDENSPQPLNTLFYLKVLDDERFVLYAKEEHAVLFNLKDESLSDYEYYFSIDGTYKFGDNIKNDYCSFKILLNSNYNSDQYQGKDLFFRFNSIQSLAYRFQENLSVKSAFFESTIADLTFTGENLDLAHEFLKRLVDKYIQKNLEKKNYNATNTIEYIDRQLSSISGSLGQSEQQLQNFQTTKDVININEKTSSLNSKMQALELNKNDLQSRYQYLSLLNDYVETNKDLSSIIAPSMSGMSDATLTTLIQELTTLSTERQNLISTNQLRNPRIKTLNANIATIKKVISDNISFSLSATQNEIDENNRRIADLNKELSNMPQTQRQLLGLERAFNINNAVYTSLLDKRIQAQIIMASNLPDCDIIEPVRYVEIASPSIKKVGVFAIFFALLFPSLYVIIVNFLSQRIRTKEDLKRFCRLPVAGSVPHNDKGQPNIISNFPQAPIAERFRSIRSNLGYYLQGEVHKCILVTSTIPNEGKSFISLNIAASFASTQKKTVLVDFDLRRSSRMLDEFNDPEIQIGISSYLIHAATLEDITIKTSIPNLDFIKSGQVPPDPVSLISAALTPKFFQELKAKYDYIIIDTPPFGLVTDAFLLMQYADISLYVSRLETITKRALRHSMEDIESKKIEHIYSVLNDMKDIDKAYAKSYSYEDNKKSTLSKLLSFIKKK